MSESPTLPRKLLASALAAALTVLSPGIEGYQAVAQVVEVPVVRAIPAAPAVAPVATALPFSNAPLGLAPVGAGLALPALTPAAAQVAPAPLAPTEMTGEGRGERRTAAPAPLAAPAAPAGRLAAVRRGVPASGLAASKGARGVSGALAERSLALSKELRAAGSVAEASGESASGLGERVMSALFGLELGPARSAGGHAAEEARQAKPDAGLKPGAAPSEKAPAAAPAPLAPTEMTGEGRGERRTAAPAAPAAEKSSAVRAESVEYATARRVLRRLSLTFGLSFSLPVAGPALAERVTQEAGTKRVVFTDYDDTLDKFAGTASPETVAAVTGVLKAGKTVVVITDRPDTKKPGAKNVTILESLESIPAADRAGLWVAANKGGRILRYDAAGQAQLVYEEPALAADEAAKVKEAADAVKARLAALGAEAHDGSKNIPSENASPYGYALMLKIGTQEAAVKAVAAAFQEELSKRGVSYEVEPRLAKDPAFPPYVTFSKLDKSLAVRRVAGLIDAKAKDALILGDSMFAPKPREVTGPRKRFLEAARALGERLSGRPAPLTGNGTDRDMEKGLPGALTLSVGGTADPMMRRAFVMPGKGPEVTRGILRAVADSRPGPRSEGDGDLAAYLAIPLIFAAGALGWYAMLTGFIEVIRAAEGALQGAWQGLPFFPMVLGLAGSLSLINRDLPDPNSVYGEAYKLASKKAAELGAGDRLRFVEATGATPTRDGDAWHFTFALPLAGGAKTADLISIDISKMFGALSGPYEHRMTVYRGAPLPQGTLTFAAEPYLMAMGVKRTPADAVAQVLREMGPTDGGWSVSLRVDEQPVSGDRDFWYNLYDNAGSHVKVNARTSELRVVRAAPKKDAPGSDRWSSLRRWLARWLGPSGPLPGSWFSERQAEPRPAVTDEEVLAAARSTISYKGRPWSQTEYNMSLYTTADSLRDRGATEAQLKVYFDTCAAAPIKGGSFNPWSGD